MCENFISSPTDKYRFAMITQQISRCNAALENAGQSLRLKNESVEHTPGVFFDLVLLSPEDALIVVAALRSYSEPLNEEYDELLKFQLNWLDYSIEDIVTKNAPTKMIYGVSL